MVALKDGFERFVARPDPNKPIVLIYGPDSGLVRERAAELTKSWTGGSTDPFGLIRIDDETLAGDPTRLIDEARTVPLFGGARVLWVKPGGRDIAKAISALADDPPPDTRIVIEGGDLKKTSPLRQLAEKHSIILAVPCYADNERDLDRLIDIEMQQARLQIDADARAHLKTLLGGDRQASRAEVQKLALYAMGRESVTLDDIELCIGDVSATLMQTVMDAALSGKPGELDRLLPKALRSGTESSALLSQTARQLLLIRKGRMLVESGTPAASAVERLGAPLFGPRKMMMTRLIERLTLPRLDDHIARLTEAAGRARGHSGMAETLASRALLSLAQSLRPGPRP